VVNLKLNIYSTLRQIMEFLLHEISSHVPESYSRQLDERVALQEQPYGYMTPPPPADTDNYDQAALESHCKYPRSKGKHE
jgi:hypothetical protein